MSQRLLGLRSRRGFGEPVWDAHCCELHDWGKRIFPPDPCSRWHSRGGDLSYAKREKHFLKLKRFFDSPETTVSSSRLELDWTTDGAYHFAYAPGLPPSAMPAAIK